MVFLLLCTSKKPPQVLEQKPNWRKFNLTEQHFGRTGIFVGHLSNITQRTQRHKERGGWRIAKDLSWSSAHTYLLHLLHPLVWAGTHHPPSSSSSEQFRIYSSNTLYILHIHNTYIVVHIYSKYTHVLLVLWPFFPLLVGHDHTNTQCLKHGVGAVWLCCQSNVINQ